MRGVSYWFFLSATLYVMTGMFLGIAMAASGDHAMASAHAHLNLVGWVTMGLFAVFYHCFPDLARGAAAKAHFALATLGVWMMVPGIALATLGRGEGLAIAGSLTTLASMGLFAVLVVRAGLAGRHAARRSLAAAALAG